MFQVQTYTSNGNRKNNEDSFAYDISPKSACFIVADGLGGHANGKEASALVSEHAIKQYVNGEKSLAKIVESCQNELVSMQKSCRDFEDMKTTIVMLHIKNKSAQWVHVGDSRLYHFHKGTVVSRTKDHSVPQKLCEMGMIKEDEIRYHPQRNQLLRAMGNAWEKPQYDVSKKKRIRKNDAFLLCSDGFWEHISDIKMEELLQEANDVKGWLDSMVEVIHNKEVNCSRDNLTAIAVMCD